MSRYPCARGRPVHLRGAGAHVRRYRQRHRPGAPYRHIVAHDYGPALAAGVARRLVVPVSRPGSASQRSVVLAHRSHMDELVHCAQDIRDDPDRLPWTLDALARDLGASRRTLPRRFAAAAGLSPQAYARAVRRERAERLHSQEASWEEAARAVGYADARSPRARRVPSASSV